jgi:3-methyl-2-oxobutanoate hydroxymethyltransferase
MIDGVAAFADDVRTRRYPEAEHGYTMAPDEAARLRELLEQEAQASEPFSGDW